MSVAVELLAQWAGLVWLAPALPLAAALLIALRQLQGVAGDAGEGPTAALARGAALGALLLLAALGTVALVAGAPGQVVLGDWFGAPGIAVPISFTLDAPALGSGLLVAFVGWATVAFSINYLHREPGFHRFFLGLELFLGGMLLIVLAGNAVLAFVGWELCGFASWLLIGFADERPQATGNALFAFVANRIGDAGFLLSIGLAYWWLGSVEWPALAGGALPETVKARMLALGLVVAALAKSAQLPFTPWLARALEGPTPSSAVFYGALLVHAGVFLLIRCNPLLQQVPDMAAAVALAGAASALYGWLCGRAASDVKTALAFATVTQVGLMVLACGLGWTTLAAWHLALHALWRAYQFLLAPSYLQLAPRPAALPAPLAASMPLYTAALQRFWLDALARTLLQRPTLALGRDVRALDVRVIERLLGTPDEAHGPAAGLAGRALTQLSNLLQRFETRLVLHGGGDALRHLQRAGEVLKALEGLLEQPRYLMLMVMATFAVIL
ncbi:proton-conducting transporter membrane subunit [Azospira restricta]|uniref:NADH-quinone oxidoreductase subunit L n=1 Tax=Azospira restricta TaxID=404405 RepID=A0A974SP52_9RHOO|nr:proton-conducting transporter membrane subunit [Azospira restricta]QRJ63866.1 hypothetical protein IWH25_00450 [Azospira restricta]